VTPAPATEEKPLSPPPAAANSGDRSVWMLLSIGLASAWLLTLMAWWWSRRQPRARPEATASNQPSLAQAMKQLKQACQSNNAATCQQALIHWGRQYYASPSINNLGEIGRRAGEPLQLAIGQLEQALYSKRSKHWSGRDIASICQRMSQPQKADRDDVAEGLEPLYK